MATIKELSKTTNSLQSMILMSSAALDVKVGFYLTQYFYTDRRSDLIVEITKNQFKLKNGAVYYVTPNGRIQFINWEGKKETMRNGKVTKEDQSYTDPSF